MDKLDFILLFCMLALTISSFSVGIIFEKNLESYKDLFDFKDYSNSTFDECTNKSLSETAGCSKRVMSTFYNYTVRDESKYNSTQGTLEDVIKNGGDCHDYTNIYEDVFKKFNHSTYRVRLMGVDSNHGFLIAYNPYHPSEYCVLDQLGVICSF